MPQSRILQLAFTGIADPGQSALHDPFLNNPARHPPSLLGTCGCQVLTAGNKYDTPTSMGNLLTENSHQAHCALGPAEDDEAGPMGEHVQGTCSTGNSSSNAT